MKRTGTFAIVIHTTAGNSNNTYQQVMDYFLKVLRWGKGGYHYIYEQSGKENMAYDPLAMEATNGILAGQIGRFWLSNANTIHLSYIGGINNTNANEAVCNITPAQEKAMINRIKALLQFYPNAGILGHNQINQKYCPSFWTPDWLRAWGIPEQNIWDLDPFNLQMLVKKLPHHLNFYQSRVNSKKVCDKCGKPL
jgi:hypothetical protein